MTSHARLALVRHGETEQNARGLWQGRSDSPLTGVGRAQAIALGERLKPHGPWNAIVTSSLGRALESARLLAAALGAPLQSPDQDLVEYDFGAWDGLAPAALEARGFWTSIADDPEFAPPGGEPFAAAARRLMAAVMRIARTGDTVVVTHGVALAAALALMLTGDARNAARYALPNGGLALLHIDTGARLISIDDPIACGVGPPAPQGRM